MIKWEDNFIKYGMCQRSIAEIQMRLTWPQVTDQPEIGSEGSHQ